MTSFSRISTCIPATRGSTEQVFRKMEFRFPVKPADFSFRRPSVFPRGCVIYMIDMLILRTSTVYPNYIPAFKAKNIRHSLDFYVHTSMHTPPYSDPSFQVGGMREEKMDGREGIFFMEKEDAEWMDCFNLHSFFCHYSNTYLATSIYSQCKRTWKVCEWMDYFPCCPPIFVTPPTPT